MEGLLKRKLIGEVEIREAAGDVYHDFFANRPHHIPTVNDNFFQSCHVIEGAFGTPGSTIEWTYTVDGKKKTIRHILDVVDEKKRMMVFNCIDGDLMKDSLNMFISTFEVVPVSEGTSKVIWTFEYEKKQPGLPEPSGELDALINLVKHIDDHHHATKEE